MNFCRIYSSRGYTFYIVVVYVVPPVLLFTYIILEYLDFSSLTGWSVSNIFFGVMVNDVLSSLLYTRYEKGSLFVVYMVVYTTSFMVFMPLYSIYSCSFNIYCSVCIIDFILCFLRREALVLL